MRVFVRKAPPDILSYVSTLRHVRNLLTTSLAATETLAEQDKQSAESIKETKQDIEKALASIKNELNRFPVKGE
jgi:hypothetical protein